MKRTLTYISGVLLLITALCISCQKEQNSLEEKGAPANEVVIRATISDAATKVSFTVDDNKLKTAWETDDSIVGWDAEGNAIELEIASIEDNTAIFKTAEGSAPIPTSGKVYMIYAPGKSKENISNSSLEYDLSNQGSGKLPALMTATGSVSDNVLALNFTNRLAIVAVKNPKFQVTEATTITGLQLSGDNILTTASFSEDDGELQMNSSELGAITRACNFTTAANGTSETMVYFAVLPNSTVADVTVSTTAPTGYQISFSDKSFTAGQCYLLDQKTIGKQKFTLTAGTITNGSITFKSGSTTITSGSSVAWGTEVTVTAAPSEGYELDGAIAVTGATSGCIPLTDNKFTMPKENVTVSGSFKKKDYTISATGTEASGTYTVTGGTYTVKNSSGTDVTKAQIDDVIKVEATPDTGYSGGEVTVKKTDTEETVDFDATSKTFTMPAADVTVTVSFTHVEYNISSTVTPASSGSVTFKKSGSEVTKAYYGEEITVVDAPATGYELESIKWKEEGGTDADITLTKTFNMPAKAVNVTVTFKESLTGVINGHTYVKIGSKKWATTNLGATNPQDYGEYFQWGETAGHECNGTTEYSTFSHNFSWASAPFNGGKSSYDEATFNSYKSTRLSGDNLKSDYDAAFKATGWGDPWHMPTKEDFADLADNGVWIWTTDYNHTGVSGYIVYVAKNDSDKGKADMNGTLKKWNGSEYEEESVALKGSYSESSVDHIFFPAAGYGDGASLSGPATYGRYWSSSLYSDNTGHAYNLYIHSRDVLPQSSRSRYFGYSVRPVSD